MTERNFYEAGWPLGTKDAINTDLRRELKRPFRSEVKVYTLDR